MNNTDTVLIAVGFVRSPPRTNIDPGALRALSQPSWIAGSTRDFYFPKN